MNDLPQPVAGLVDVLAAMPGAVAVALGGSRALGSNDAGSDWDFGVYADGRLYFFSQDGATTVLRPGRRFEALATNTLASGFMASPAASTASGKAFFLRTKTDLYRIESR